MTSNFPRKEQPTITWTSYQSQTSLPSTLKIFIIFYPNKLIIHKIKWTKYKFEVKQTSSILSSNLFISSVMDCGCSNFRSSSLLHQWRSPSPLPHCLLSSKTLLVNPLFISSTTFLNFFFSFWLNLVADCFYFTESKAFEPG